MLARVISALLGVGALLATWHFGGTQGLVAICSIVTLVCCFEFSTMVEKKNNLVRLLFVCITFSFYLLYTFFSQSFITFMSLFVTLVAYFILCVDDSIESRIHRLTSWTVGALYCGGFTGVVTHGVLEYEGPFFVALLALSFCTDTFAFFGGKTLGKTPLAPMISPKKTLEGSLVGLIGGSGCGFLFLNQLPNSSPVWVTVIVCVAASLFSQVGDLFESTIKRFSGVKDSGRIMPGHGGFLDRIDGLLFAGPVVYLWMQTFT